MKHIFNYISLAVLCYLVAGCKKSPLLSFGEPAAVYFYKASYDVNADSTVYSFAIKPDTLLVDTVKIPLRISGEAAPVIREVSVSPVTDSTTAVAGTHYTLQSYTIPAGAYTGTVAVLVKRSPDLKQKNVKLLLQIIPSKDFEPGVLDSKGNGKVSGGATRYLIVINDYLTKPSNWDSRLVYFFGAYSAVKYKLMIQTLGTAIIPDSLPYGQFTAYATLCKQALDKYETEHGPLIDENGVQISFD
ncbi:MAG TPA: DUF4843 domain-containing protein [Chitinophaga sp.]|uniref:DUF4843 domain-containing protein n=1 Tax=Chitinophaga sp. TaxID=1869181 RepID=UPI002BA0722E|nr:DUF4843 domain-containing protein [Chitinophaga sp.]HVI48530.1 DUF4843 domain-containing protein [Chitinophaga sp.]